MGLETILCPSCNEQFQEAVDGEIIEINAGGLSVLGTLTGSKKSKALECPHCGRSSVVIFRKY